MEESERDEGFKVSDKRRFTSEGEVKSEDVAPQEEPVQGETPSTEEPRRPDGREPPPPLDFS